MVKKIIVFGALFLALGVEARIMMIQDPNTDRFRSKTSFEVNNITTPKVVSFVTSQYLGRFTALQDQETKEFLPHRIIEEVVPFVFKHTLSVSSTLDGKVQYLQDNKSQTFLTFDSAENFHTVSFQNNAQETLNGFETQLSADTLSPLKITIEAQLSPEGEWKKIVNNQPYRSYIKFPAITPTAIKVIYESPNLLHISEFKPMTPEIESYKKNKIIFYGREGQSLILWSDPDFGQDQIPVSPTTSNSYKIDQATPIFDLPANQANPIYNPDFDKDGLIDSQDLCPKSYDPENTDLDNNQRGDVCEDPDQDGITSEYDNCPFEVNRDQSDQDADGVGDVCDKEESRYTEQSNYWMKISFGVMILALFFLIIRSALKKEEAPAEENESK